MRHRIHTGRAQRRLRRRMNYRAALRVILRPRVLRQRAPREQPPALEPWQESTIGTIEGRS